MKKLKPIHKFNGGLGATLCHSCSVIISIGLREDLYCERCKCKDCSQSLEDCICIEDTLDMKETTKCYCGHTTYCDCGPEEHVELINSNIEEFDKAIELSKQETVDLAYLNKLIDEANKEFTLDRKLAKEVAIKFAKWQQKRMYSEVELFINEVKDKIDSFEHSVNQKSYISEYLDEWFENLKKK